MARAKKEVQKELFSDEGISEKYKEVSEAYELWLSDKTVYKLKLLRTATMSLRNKIVAKLGETP